MYHRTDVARLQMAVDADTLTHGHLMDFMRYCRDLRQAIESETNVRLSDAESNAMVVVAAARAGWIEAPAPESLTLENVRASSPAVIMRWGRVINAVYLGAQTVDPKALLPSSAGLTAKPEANPSS